MLHSKRHFVPCKETMRTIGCRVMGYTYRVITKISADDNIFDDHKGPIYIILYIINSCARTLQEFPDR